MFDLNSHPPPSSQTALTWNPSLPLLPAVGCNESSCRIMSLSSSGSTNLFLLGGSSPENSYGRFGAVQSVWRLDFDYNSTMCYLNLLGQSHVVPKLNLITFSKRIEKLLRIPELDLPPFGEFYLSNWKSCMQITTAVVGSHSRKTLLNAW